MRERGPSIYIDEKGSIIAIRVTDMTGGKGQKRRFVDLTGGGDQFGAPPPGPPLPSTTAAEAKTASKSLRRPPVPVVSSAPVVAKAPVTAAKVLGAKGGRPPPRPPPKPPAAIPRPAAAAVADWAGESSAWSRDVLSTGLEAAPRPPPLPKQQKPEPFSASDEFACCCKSAALASKRL